MPAQTVSAFFSIVEKKVWGGVKPMLDFIIPKAFNGVSQWGLIYGSGLIILS